MPFQIGDEAVIATIEFRDSAHAIACFNTTDGGLVFVEPQWDDIVTLPIGQSYSDVNGYESPLDDDTIVRYVIVG